MIHNFQFAPNVEVTGKYVLSTVNSFLSFMKSVAMKIISNKSITNLQVDNCHSQQARLNLIIEISQKYGSNTLF